LKRGLLKQAKGAGVVRRENIMSLGELCGGREE
jgi:hypothetical protein